MTQASSGNSTDLRLATADQVRHAALHGGIACRHDKPQALGTVVTGALQFAALAPSLPEAAASELACALNAPNTASCADILNCAHVANPPVSSVATCSGDDLIGISRDGSPTLRVHCADFGEHCFSTEVGAMCGVEPCAAGATYSCDGDVAEACVQGIRTRNVCGHGRTCGPRPDGILDCIGSTGSCTGKARCDGTVAINCLTPPGSKAGTEARVDCADFGMACGAAEPVNKVVCVPAQGSCDPDTSPARCSGDSITVCVAGSWWSAACAEFGRKGKCSNGGGVKGEATCI